MSGKPVKVMMLLCPAQCDFEELFLSLQHWVIKMGGGEFLVHLPISALCVQCSFFSPALCHRAFIWCLGALYLTLFQDHVAASLDKTVFYSHLDGLCEAHGQTKIKEVFALLSNLFFRLYASVNPSGKVVD